MGAGVLARLGGLAVALSLAVALGMAIARTGRVEQDAAYYCEVAERLAAGAGATSLSERGGPGVGPVEFPRDYRGSTLWPWLLAPCAAVWGDAARPGAVLSLLALLAALGLTIAAIARATGAPLAWAVACGAAALTGRDACLVATLPLSDATSLALNAAVLWALVRDHRRTAWLLAAGACAVRFQNVALLWPLLGALPGPHARRLAWPTAAAAAFVGGVLHTGGASLQGMAVALDPWQRDSLFRGMRGLSAPLLLGLVAAGRIPALRPFWLLGLGHLLVLLAAPDLSAERPWLFADRHGLPFYLVAAALGAAALGGMPVATRAQTALRALAITGIAFAAVEHAPRPWKLMAGTPERTARPELDAPIAWLRDHPLPAGSAVLSHDADVLAREARTPAVHLRGTPPGPALRAHLAGRTVSHVLLTWRAHRHLRARNDRMSEIERTLRSSSSVVAEWSTESTRAVLLRL